MLFIIHYPHWPRVELLKIFLIFVLGFSIFPGGVWVLETGREYVITVDVYDKQNHKLYVAEVSRVFVYAKFIHGQFLLYIINFDL